KWLEEREARRAERRRQHEVERQAARPSPNGDNGPADATVSDRPPSPNGGNGQAPSSDPMLDAPLPNGEPTVDEGEWVPDGPSPNGDLGGVSAEEWAEVMRRLLGEDFPPPPDLGT